MSRRSEELSSHELYKRKTTMALVPVVVHRRRFSVEAEAATSHMLGWSVIPLLLLLGTLMEGLLFALVPLLAGAKIVTTDPVQQALPGLFPWSVQLYWTTLDPQILHWLTLVPLFDPMRDSLGNANLQILLLGLAFLLSLLAARLGHLVVRWRVSSVVSGIFFLLALLFTALIGMTLLFAPLRPEAFSQAMLNYGLYGRMVVVYHVNPYMASPALFAHDMLHVVIPHISAGSGTISAGPVWLDLSLLVALFAHDSVANVLLGFRCIGLVAHLLNVILIWSILGRVKPELRLSGVLLYAWNPLVLLLSIFMVHQEVVVVLFLLLAVLFLLRNAPLMSWVFALLAVLVSPVCLIVLPLLLVMAFRQSRELRLGRLVLWWLTFWLVTVLVFVLAYAPYWQGLGLAGLQASLQQTFWPDMAMNSLDAALLNLPVQMPGALVWLLMPQHWSMVALAIVALFLLFSLWLINTIDLFVLCASWIFLLLILLMPVYWPWYILIPLALALSASGRGTAQLAILLSLGGLLCYYFWLWPAVWAGQGLLIVGLLFVIWGWVLFFSSTWRRNRGDEEDAVVIL
jgi:hypothetical protein